MRSPIRLLSLLTLLALAAASWAQNSGSATADDLVVTAQRELARGNVHEAIGELSRAAEMRPGWTTPHALLALVYQEANREAEALAEYKAVQEASWPVAKKDTQPALTPKFDERKTTDRSGDVPKTDEFRTHRSDAGDTGLQARGDGTSERGGRTQIITAEARLMWLVNKERAARNLELLRPVAIMGVVARQHSEEMRDLKYWSHHSPVPEHESVMERFNLVCGFKPQLIAENLARRWGTDYCFSVAKVECSHNDLMESQGHRENILREGVTTLGVGIAVDAKGAYWVTEVFAYCGAEALEGQKARAQSRPH